MRPYDFFMAKVAGITHIDAAAFVKQFGHLDATGMAKELHGLGKTHGDRSVQASFHPDRLQHAQIPQGHRVKLDEAYRKWQGGQVGSAGSQTRANPGSSRPNPGQTSTGGSGFGGGAGPGHAGFGGPEWDDLFRRASERRSAAGGSQQSRAQGSHWDDLHRQSQQFRQDWDDMHRRQRHEDTVAAGVGLAGVGIAAAISHFANKRQARLAAQQAARVRRVGMAGLAGVGAATLGGLGLAALGRARQRQKAAHA